MFETMSGLNVKRSRGKGFMFTSERVHLSNAINYVIAAVFECKGNVPLFYTLRSMVLV